MTVMDTRRRNAARLARLLRPAAAAAGAWVSAEAAVRVAPEQLWHPALVVALGDLPPDGVADSMPLLVVECDFERFGRWLEVPRARVWAPSGDVVATLDRGRVGTAGSDEMLTVADHKWLALPASALLAAAS